MLCLMSVRSIARFLVSLYSGCLFVLLALHQPRCTLARKCTVTPARPSPDTTAHGNGTIVSTLGPGIRHYFPCPLCVHACGITYRFRAGNTGTSMVCELGDDTAEITREDVVADILNEIEALMARSLEDTVDQYRNLDMLQGNVVRVCHKSREEASAEDYDATVVGYNVTDGRLRVVPTGKDAGDPTNEVLLSGEEISIKV
eukprot:m.113005 g.113005  ORF g.113005 m.113005 type:complete len:201 (-) comp17055_c0_seq3:408-1010(-)